MSSSTPTTPDPATNGAAPPSETEHYPVIIVGGGQAGLSMSYCLKQRGIRHVIFEKHRLAEAWRSKRWDNFCLVTPNWQCKLPGFDYPGKDPNGFMKKDEIVEYIQAYAYSFDPPLKEDVEVLKLVRGENGFRVSTSLGEFTSDQLVVATGGYHIAELPRLSERFPDSIKQLHSSAYTKASDLPPGAVLVVGSGQSGCQIAEDLHLEGRQVHLCVGSAPRTARKYRGKDVVDWLHDMGYYNMPVHEHPLKERVRAKANHYVTGRDGGRDIDLRRFALEGMKLHGRLKAINGSILTLGDDLKKNLDNADSVAESIKDSIDKFIASKGIDAPVEERYRPVWEPAVHESELDFAAAGITTILWSNGYKTDYKWIELPIFDGKGYPSHQRGVTAVPGVYFLGLPWQYTWGSGRFSGVAQDAWYLADCLEARYAAPAQTGRRGLNELALGS